MIESTPAPTVWTTSSEVIAGKRYDRSTPKGRGTFPILVALRQWSEEFDARPEEIATILVDRKNGRPVRKLELRAQDGRLLDAADTALPS